MSYDVHWCGLVVVNISVLIYDNVSGKITNTFLLLLYTTTGNSKSGKTTLATVLKEVLDVCSCRHIDMVEDVEELTAGIIPTHFYS